MSPRLNLGVNSDVGSVVGVSMGVFYNAGAVMSTMMLQKV